MEFTEDFTLYNNLITSQEKSLKTFSVVTNSVTINSSVIL